MAIAPKVKSQDVTLPNSESAFDSLYTAAFDSLTQNLNNIGRRSYFSSLLDRVVPLSDLKLWGGETAPPSTKTDFNQCVSQYCASNYRQDLLDDFNLKIAKYTNQTKGGIPVYPIGILNVEADALDTGAIAKGNLYVGQDGLLYPGNSYYITTDTYIKTAVLSDAIEAPVGNKNYFYFLLTPELILQTSLEPYSQETHPDPNWVSSFSNIIGVRISEIFPRDYSDSEEQLDQDVSIDQSVALDGLNCTGRLIKVISRGSQNNPGERTFKLYLRLENGATTIRTFTIYDKAIYLYSNAASAKVNKQALVASGYEKAPSAEKEITASIGFQGPDESSITKGHGLLSFYYHDGSKKLSKPMIIINGFDPTNSHLATDIFNKDLVINGSSLKYGEQLNTKGYDVIILTFPGNGADYIERNSFVLVEAINIINQRLKDEGNPAKLVIIGPSMGGLISRYALAWMEQNNMDHNTRLWISFDAPHLGANIPVADQEFINLLADTQGGTTVAQRDISLDSKAAHEMLIDAYSSHINHVPKVSASYFNGVLLPKGYMDVHDQWQAKLDQIGWPMKLRKVALLNGTLTGKLNGQGCANVLDLRININLVYGLLNFQAGKFQVGFAPAFNNSCQVLSFNLKGIFRQYYSAGFPYSESLDVCPGSLFNAQAQIREPFLLQARQTGDIFGEIIPGAFGQTVGAFAEFAALLFHYYTNGYSRSENSYHTFIPSVSALALKGTNRNLGEVLTDRDLVATGETPFDAYFAPNKNEGHITLTTENVKWINEQLGDDSGTIPPCTPKVNVTTLKIKRGYNEQWENSLRDYAVGFRTTQNPLYDPDQNTFKFSVALPANSVYKWQTSSNMQVLAQDTATALIMPKPYTTDKREEGIIYFLVYQCGKWDTIKRNMYWGFTSGSIVENLSGKKIPLTIANTYNLCPGILYYAEYVNFLSGPAAPAGRYEFANYPPNGIVPSGFLQFQPSPSSTKTLYNYTMIYPPLSFGQGVRDDDNFKFKKLITFSIPDVCSGSTSAFNVYPNPANSTLSVADINSTQVTQINTNASSLFPISKNSTPKKYVDFQGYLMDSQNNKLRSAASINGSFKLDIENLPMGFYYLHLYRNNKLLERRNIQIIH